MPRLSLGSAIADLTKARKHWQKYLPGLSDSLAPSAETTSGGRVRLKEVVEFGDNPGALKMWTYAPKSVRAHPALVVVLHGCTQNAAGYDHHSGWTKLADNHGFVLLYAEQQTANNANTCFNWFLPGDVQRGQGEALSIRQMIETVVVDRKIDRRRIFITGLSAGGAMTSVMLATYPEIFAAGCIIAGLPYGCAGNVMEALGAMKSAPRRTAQEWGNSIRHATDYAGPWPRIAVWHGAGDRTVSLSNGRACASQWTDVHGLKETVFCETTLSPTTTQRLWSGADGIPRVELYTITGLGHGTPLDPAGRSGEASGIAGPFMLDAGISSTLVMAKRWGIA